MELKGFRALGEHIARYEDAALEAHAPDEAMRQKVAERVRKPRPGRRARVAYALGAIAAAAAIALGIAAFRRPPIEQPLAFTVGEPARPGVLREWASALPGRELPIRFSDGSAVMLGSDARARVVRVAATGADVVIESGRALIDVVPHETNEWHIRTGPFVVAVTGTRFDVRWSPQTDELTVKLFEGSVRVSGCALGDGHLLSAGQELRASCARGSLALGRISDREPLPDEDERIGSSAPAPASAAPAVESRAAEPGPAKAAIAAARPAPSAKTPVESWQELARGGHFRRAYEIARASGFEAECQRVGAEELLLLGDSARLAGQSSHALHAYITVRQRFGGTGASARAAFALGRAAFSSGQSASAAQWFQTYLAEQPGGPLAAAALGRLLESYARMGNSGQAAAVAERYLQRFPGGPHADQARKVLGRAEPPAQE